MRTAGVLLLTAASALLGGCILADDAGRQHPRCRSPTTRPSSPATVGPSVARLYRDEPRRRRCRRVVSLIPTKHPLRDRGMLYLNGQFTYTCMTELMYAAKSGANRLRERPDKECRQEYLIRQGELKRAGKPYDTCARLRV